jgi:hypothetical protein
MKDFREQAGEGFKTASEKFEEEIGIPLLDVLQLPKGEASLAVASAGGPDLGVILFANVGEDKSVLDKLLDKFDESLADSRTKSSETVDDVEITTWTRNTDDAGDGQKQPDLSKDVSYFIRDSFVVFSTSKALLTGTLDRWDGKSTDTFGDNPVYRDIITACRESADQESDIYYFVDPVAFVSAAMAADPQQAMYAMMFSANLSKFGLDNLKGIGGASSLKSDQFDSVTRTLFFAPDKLTGVLGLFHFPAIAQSPPAWVRDTVEQYSSVNWDVQGAYQSVADTYTALTGKTGALDDMMDQAARNPNGPGINPKKDVIDQLTGMIHFVADTATADDAEKQRMLFALGIKNDVQFLSVIEKIAAKIPVLKKRDFEGTAIYEIETPNADEDAGIPALSVHKGRLFIGTDVAALEDALRSSSGSETLAGSDAYRTVSRHFPSQVSSLSFTRAGAGIETFWNQLRDGTLGQLDGLDFSSLPEFSAVKKHFPAGGSYVVPDEKGAMIIQFSLPGN